MTTFFVDKTNPSASNSNAGTNASLPWLTIARANSSVAAGDTVMVLAGAYNERPVLTVAGNSTQRVTYDGNGQAVVRGFTVNSSYTTIQNFEITCQGMSADSLDSVYVGDGTTRVIVRGNDIHDVPAFAVCNRNAASGVTFLEISSNSLAYTGATMVILPNKGTNIAPTIFTITAGVNDQIKFTSQGVTYQKTLPPGTYSWNPPVWNDLAEAMGKLHQVTSGDVLFGTGVAMEAGASGNMCLISETQGPASSLSLLAVANDAYSALGWTVGPGFKMGISAALGGGIGNDCLIENNDAIYYNEFAQIGNGVSRLVVRNNVMGINPTFSFCHHDGVLSGGNNHKILIEGNSAIDNHSADSRLPLGLFEEPDDDHVIARFNWDVRGKGTVGFTLGAHGLWLYNNTIGVNAANHLNSGGTQVYCESGPSDSFAKNNIWHNSIAGNTDPYQYSAGRLTADHDIYFGATGPPMGTAHIHADPLFVNLTAGDYHLLAGSPGISAGGALTTVASGDPGSGTLLAVVNAHGLQDGWAGVQPDWIAVGTTANVAQVASINYATNVITLASALARSAGQSVWLYKKSDGEIVLPAAGPNIGAFGVGTPEIGGPPGGGYSTAFTVQAGKVSGTLTNFPVLVKPVDNRFRTVANGGHVANGNGYDLRPYADAALTTPLAFQLVSGTYDGTTGAFEMWVQVPSLATGTVIYLGYGDASFTTNGSSATVWDSNFVGVWHLGDGVSLNLSDATANARTLTNSGGVTATAGKIDGAANFPGGYELTTAALTMGTSLTVSLWVNANFSSSGEMYVEKSPVNAAWALFGLSGNVTLRGASTASDLTTTAPTAGVWNYLAASISGTAGKLYVNGLAPVTGAVTAAGNTNSAIHIGSYDGAGFFFGGKLDEIRISNIVRADNWLAAEYANGSDPVAFYTMAAEIAAGGPPAPAPVVGMLYPFRMRGVIAAPPEITPPPTVGTGWTQVSTAPVVAYAPVVTGNTNWNSTAPIDFPSQISSYPPGAGGLMAWSGGCMDTLRNRLIVLGGGHNNYPGNELYAFSLNTQTISRLNSPSVPTYWQGPDPVILTLADGKPNNRHTFGGVCYLENVDRLLMFGGVPTCGSGGFANDTWTCNMATLAWQHMNPSGTIPDLSGSAHGGACVYDPATHLVFMHCTHHYFRYDYAANSWTQLTAFTVDTDHTHAVIDPVRKIFMQFGSNAYYKVDITPGSSYIPTLVIPTGGGPSHSSPGLTYHPGLDRIVAWDGGDAWILDVDANVWTQAVFTGDAAAPAAQEPTGTYGRFAYSPTSDAIALVNSTYENPYLLGLTAVGTASPTNILTLQSTTTAILPFVTAMGFKKGDFTDTPRLNLTEYQVVVKRHWNDGSVKHALIAGKAALVSGTPFTITATTTGTLPSGTNLTAASIAAANPSASLQCGSIGTVNLSSLLATPTMTWVSGPEFVECHYRAAVGSDTSLVAAFQVRMWKSGKLWVRVIAENGYIDATTVDKTYVPTVIISGATVYNNGGAALLHCAHTRWMAEAWIGGDPGVTVTHNRTYLTDAKLVPNYWKHNPSDAALNLNTTIYTPMSNGNQFADMGSTGFQPSIGLLPNWAALYVTSGDPRAFKSAMANASHLNSYPILWRSATTGRIAKPTDFPTFAIAGTGDDKWVSSAGLKWEVNHAPSEGYLTYLVTGDYWHYETLLAQTALIYFSMPPSRGSGLSKALSFQTRGFAWNIRTFSLLSAIFPEGDAVAADLQSVLSYNAHILSDTVNAILAANSSNTLGYFYADDLVTNVYGTGLLAPWQQHFFMQSLGFGSDLEPLATMTEYINTRNYAYKGVVGILGTAATYCFGTASEYNIKADDVSGDSDPRNWYSDWATVFDACVAVGIFPDVGCGTALLGFSGGAPSAATSGFWGNLLPAIAYAVDHAAPGAAAAWARLTGASNFSTLENNTDTGGFADTPVWGIVPRGF